MTLPVLAIIFFAVGLFLILAEVFLPAGGLVGLLGGLAIVAAVAMCFFIQPWIGLALAAGLLVASPFAMGLWFKLWPRTPIGRRLVLAPPAEAASGPVVQIGQTGLAVSELRPMGICEFNDQRFEAQSEHGVVAPGSSVRVVALLEGRPVVRVLSA